jgi:ABC-type dipeptide/oligopeptide/nickel transport system permease subunit
VRPSSSADKSLFAQVAVAVLAVLISSALLAPVLATHDPALPSGVPFSPPGPDHLLGTNDIGQDVWSQWVWGARASLVIAAVVTVVSTALSWGVGLAAGLWPGGEALLVGVADVLLALPAVPLYLLVMALIGPGQIHLMLVLGLLSWPAFARVVRARVIAVRREAYIEAARALGADPLRVAVQHVAPATLELLPAKLVLTVRFAIFAEATLAFLGLGDPSAPSWGTMLGWAFRNPIAFVDGSWTWWVLPPALAIVAAVLSTTWLATAEYDIRQEDGVRDRPSDAPLASEPLEIRARSRSGAAGAAKGEVRAARGFSRRVGPRWL